MNRYYPQFPPIPPSFPELSELSHSQLSDLDRSDDRLEEFLEKLPQTRQIQDNLDALTASTKELAERNFEKQPIVEQGKAHILQKLDELSALKAEYDLFTQKYQTLADKYAPSSIQEKLKVAAQEAEEESEVVAEKFLAKELEVESFLQQYIEKRKLSHCRRVKEEKLHNQLKELQKAGF